jgi:hypothetical protein
MDSPYDDFLWIHRLGIEILTRWTSMTERKGDNSEENNHVDCDYEIFSYWLHLLLEGLVLDWLNKKRFVELQLFTDECTTRSYNAVLSIVKI